MNVREQIEWFLNRIRDENNLLMILLFIVQKFTEEENAQIEATN